MLTIRAVAVRMAYAWLLQNASPIITSRSSDRMQALRIKKTFSVPRIITEPAIQCRRANRGVPRPVCAAGHGARGLCHVHCADLGPGDCAAAPEPVRGLARTARSHGGDWTECVLRCAVCWRRLAISASGAGAARPADYLLSDRQTD